MTAAIISRIGQAERIHAAVMAEQWPASREAMAAIGYAAGYAAECLTTHARLRSRDLDWQRYDADLMFFGGDPQREAIAIAGDRAYDAALAAMNRLREYQRREKAREDAETMIAARRIGGLP